MGTLRVRSAPVRALLSHPDGDGGGPVTQTVRQGR